MNFLDAAKKVLLLIGIIGTTLVIIIPLVGIALGQEAFKFYGFFLMGVPFIIISWPYGIYKSTKNPETKYGIRFWGAIKYAPKWMLLTFIVVGLLVLIVSLFKPEVGLIGVIPLFDYTALLICLSSFLEK